MGNVSNLKLDEAIELLAALFHFGYGSKEIFEEIEKHLGKNIESLSADKIFLVLSTFVQSGKMRPKFLLLIQKRVVEIKEKFAVKDLTKILRIYTSVETQYEYIYEKLEKYLLTLKDYLGSEELANLVFSYSNPNIKSKYFILNDLEDIIINKLDTMATERAFEPIVDILYSYLFCKKGEKRLIDKLFHVLTNAKEELGLSANGHFKLYFCFVELKTPLAITTKFDSSLLQKSVSLSKNDLISINTFLRQLNYSNIDTLTILDNLMKIEMSHLNDDEKFEKKCSTLSDYGIKPIFDLFKF